MVPSTFTRSLLFVAGNITAYLLWGSTPLRVLESPRENASAAATTIQYQLTATFATGRECLDQQKKLEARRKSGEKCLFNLPNAEAAPLAPSRTPLQHIPMPAVAPPPPGPKCCSQGAGGKGTEPASGNVTQGPSQTVPKVPQFRKYSSAGGTLLNTPAFGRTCQFPAAAAFSPGSGGPGNVVSGTGASGSTMAPAAQGAPDAGRSSGTAGGGAAGLSAPVLSRPPPAKLTFAKRKTVAWSEGQPAAKAAKVTAAGVPAKKPTKTAAAKLGEAPKPPRAKAPAKPRQKAAAKPPAPIGGGPPLQPPETAAVLIARTEPAVAEPAGAAAPAHTLLPSLLLGGLPLPAAGTVPSVLLAAGDTGALLGVREIGAGGGGVPEPAAVKAPARARVKAGDLDPVAVDAKVREKFGAGRAEDLTVPEMKCFLKSLKLGVGGKKADLIARISAAL